MSENQISRRAKENLPTVLLTLLSIVQALALELMWSHLIDQDYLYEPSFAAVLGWLQIGATLLGILLIWLIYSGLVMRFSWLPTTTDSIFPFLVGIIEFALIGALGPSTLGQWFLIVSLLFATMTWVTQITMRRARLDGGNDEFFSTVAPANRRDLGISLIPVAALALVGCYLWVSGNQGWFALIAVIGAATLLGGQMWMNDVYTQRSYRANT